VSVLYRNAGNALQQQRVAHYYHGKLAPEAMRDIP
jgi:hypothetical protein